MRAHTEVDPIMFEVIRNILVHGEVFTSAWGGGNRA